MNIATLGPDYQQKIEDLIHIHLSKIHDGNGGSYRYITEFLKAESHLREDLYSKIKYYERFCTQYREVNHLQPFNWELETIDCVRSCFESKSGRSFVPLTVAARLKRQERIAQRGIPQNTDAMSPRELTQTQKIKPEYQGVNHPLEQCQVKRERKTVKASDAAIAALKQFDTTGKLIIPDNSQSRIQHDRDYKQWLREMPAIKKTAVEAEPVSAIIADVSKRLKVVLDNPSNPNFKTFTEKYKS